MLTQGMYIADRYEILEKIGTGGMSDVFKAMDHILSREVAVKVLKAEYSDDTNFVSKFRAEAQSAAGLEHPNIVNIYDVGEEDGTYYIVMEYIEGITLKTYIEKKGQLNFKEAISIAIQVGRGIDAAHSKGIIHRDIKPQNIMISTEGKVKVTDFGIARAATSNTVHADVMGSVHYTSPEQARNGFVDGKTDIYSLGIVMYEMVTGRVPYDGESTVNVALKHLQEEMVNPSEYAEDLPISLEKIILKSTMKSADRRYQTMTELLTDLKKALVNPDEDFVVLAETVSDATRVITADDQAQIKEQLAEENRKAVRKAIEDEDDGDDEDVNPKLEKAIQIMTIAIGVVIVAIVVGLLGTITGIFHFGGKQVAMPELYSLEEQAAIETLTDMGFKEKKITVVYESSTEVNEGCVFKQSIEAGVEVSTRTEVEITVNGTGSSTPSTPSNEKGGDDDEVESVLVPEVTGYEEDSAIKAIQDKGLKYNRTYEYSESVAAGKVISQNPKGGKDAKTGDTVNIVVSQGKDTVAMPNVVGKDGNTAKTEIEAAGLNISSISTDYSNTVAEGSVISQSIAAGKMVDSGTNVTLVVSLGAKITYFYKYQNSAMQEVYVVLTDANGTSQSTTLAIGQTVTFSKIKTSSGTLTVYAADKSTQISSQNVSFSAE